MSEKRKSINTILLKKEGKQVLKVEVYKSEDFKKSVQGKFRLRVNGKWHGDKKGEYTFLTKYEIAGGFLFHRVADSITSEFDYLYDSIRD